MDNEELAALIDREVTNSIGYFDSKLSTQRREAMEDYLGEPYGNEVEGRSHYVSRDVADTVEGIMPSIMRIFTSTDEICKFEPQNLEDQNGASQASDAVNYVFTRQNNGFVVLYTFLKDALLQKNGFCKVYWEDYSKKTVEEYGNLTPEQFAVLMVSFKEAGKEIASVEQTEYGVKFTLLDTDGKICIDPIPPEEIRVNKNASWDLQRCRFVSHERHLTASEIREMGIEFNDEFEGYDELENQERQTRFSHDQEDTMDDDGGHEPNTLYKVQECYPLVDFDDDGIAERRHVIKSGKQICKTVDGEDCNWEIDRVPIVTTTPILMPHKLFGQSVADIVSDLQLLKTTLVRSILDNMYLTNNSRVLALDGMVNIDDLLTVRPGGVVRVKTFDAVKPLQVPFFGAPAFQMLGYIDQVREVRSGQRHFQGIDPDAINKDVSGIALDKVAQASMEKIELIARIFAETGIKEMMLSIYALIQKHWKKERFIRLRNDWIKVDPREWKNQYDLVVTVGLGTGGKAQFLQGAQMIGQIQAEIVKNGGLGRVVTEQNVYNYAREVADTITPRKADLFFTDPSKLGPPQPKPDPEMEKIQAGKEKAAMQDKTKRDVAAVNFLQQVASLAKPQPDNSQNEADQREHEIGMERMKQGHDLGKQAIDIQARKEDEMDKLMLHQLQTQQQELSKTFQQAQQEMSKAIQQMSEAIAQQSKIMSAPKKLVMDANGEPVGVEPQLG